ncbi:MAG: NAD(P)-binding protein [bacterium]
MGLLKDKKKLTTRGSGASSRELSPLRPSGIPKPAPCGAEGCPNHNPIRRTLMTIQKRTELGLSEEQVFTEAFNVFAEAQPFLSVCGRVCPHPCETACNRKDKEGAVGINSLERFLGDFAIEKGLKPPMVTNDKRNEKIAIVGAGPAGLSCAYQLARRGYNVTVFEAFGKTGGMLRYGIPDYRLPQSILDAEIQRIADMGVEIKTNTMIGKEISFDQLKSDFNATFVGIGAHRGYNLRVDGEDAPNVMTGVDLLHRVNAGETVDLGSKVVVVGGGDTAIDAARIARRLGCEATILYRRTRTEMPAIEEEIVGAEEENVGIEFLAAPIEIFQNNGRATGMKCQRMELGEPDSSGRRRPVPIDGDTFDVDFTTLITAISQQPNFDGFEQFIEGKDWIKVDGKFKTQIENAFSGGDNVNLGLVIDAIYHGRRAAEAIHEMFSHETMPQGPTGEIVHIDKMAHAFYEEKQPIRVEQVSVDDRLKVIDKEITPTFTQDQALGEAGRCMSCGMCFDCSTCWSLCSDSAITKPLDRGGFVVGRGEYHFKHDVCTGCKKCAEQCPCGFIEMH